MKLLRVFGLSCLVMGLSVVQARITVSADLSTDTYLLFEGIRYQVTISNESRTPLQFGGQAANSEIFMMVNEVSGGSVDPVAKPFSNDVWRIAPGETSSRTLDLVQLFKLRKDGSFRLTTRVQLPNQALSDKPVMFNISKGMPVDSLQSKEADRKYNLVELHRNKENHLMLQITDFKGTRVLQTYFLGTTIRFYPPEFRQGVEGDIAVLHRLEPNKLQLSRFKKDGKPILKQRLPIERNERFRLVEDPEQGFVVRGAQGKLQKIDKDDPYEARR